MNTKYFLALLGLVISSVFSCSSEPVSTDSVWIRPIKEDTITNKEHNGAEYRLYKDSYVIVRSEKNGDIIIGTDTLKSDESVYTDGSRKKDVPRSYVTDSYKLQDSIKIVNDSILIFALSDFEGDRNFKLYVNNEQKERCTIKTGSNDTIILAEWKLSSNQIKRIVLIPDTALALYIPYDKINHVIMDSLISEDSTDSASSNSTLLHILAGILILAIVSAIVFYFYFTSKNKKSRGTDSDKKKELESVYAAFAKQKEEANLSVSSHVSNNQYNFAVNKAENAVNNLHGALLENITIIDDDTFNECVTTIKDMTALLKKMQKKEDTNNISDSAKNIDDCTIKLNQLYTTLEGKLENAKNTSSPDSSEHPEMKPQEETTIVPDFSEVSEDVKKYIDHLHKQIEDIEEKKNQRILEIQNNYKRLNHSLEQEQKAKEDLEKRLQSASNELEKEKQNREATITQKVQKAKEAANREIKEANNRAARAEEKSKTIKDELNAKFDVERRTAKEKEDQLKSKLSATQSSLDEANKTLQSTKNTLKQTERMVENLTAETESFHKHLSGAIDSIPYCENIVRLVDLANRIQEAAGKLLQSDMEDKYFVYKPLALYFAKMSSINMQNFYTDVEMVAKTGFVIKGSPLASYDTKLSKDEITKMTRIYFFTNYLKTYVNALVVLNESLAGLNYLAEDAKVSEIRIFAKFRQEIEEVTRKLGINVLTVKLYDSVGVNTDLLATEVDAGVEKHGAILEIENCKVSLINGAPDNERIRVKIQK